MKNSSSPFVSIVGLLALLFILMPFLDSPNAFHSSNDSSTKEAQIAIAQGDNFEAKESLLKSKNLHSEALIALCNHPEPMNLENEEVQSWFKNAIKRTELTTKQQVQIAKIGNFVYNSALLLRDKLSAEGLLVICQKAEVFNLENEDVQSWFKNAIKRTELTAEQKAQIAKSKIKDSAAILKGFM